MISCHDFCLHSEHFEQIEDHGLNIPRRNETHIEKRILFVWHTSRCHQAHGTPVTEYGGDIRIVIPWSLQTANFVTICIRLVDD